MKAHKKWVAKACAFGLALFMTMGLFTGCSSSAVFFTVNGNTVTQGYFSYYVNSTMYTYYQALGTNMPASTDSVSANQTFGELIKEQSYNAILKEFALMKLGEENGIKLSAEDKTNADSMKQSNIKQMGTQSDYIKYLNNLGMTDADYNKICLNSVYLYRIYTQLSAKGSKYYATAAEIKTITDDFNKNYMNMQYIYVTTQDSTGKALDADAIAAKRKTIDAALAKAQKGDNFATLITNYSEDVSSRQSPYNMYLTKTSSDEKNVGAATAALKIGEISGVVEGTTGLFVIKRIAKDSSYIDTLINSYVGNRVYDQRDKLVAGLAVVKTDAYNNFVVSYSK